MNQATLVRIRQKKKPDLYKLISGLNELGNVCSIVINHLSTIVVVGLQDQIKIFDFKEGQLTLKQTLKGQFGLVAALTFMKKQNTFISGNTNGDIIFWTFNGDYYQELFVKKYGTQMFFQLILNSRDDLLICLGTDIMIITEQSQWECTQILPYYQNTLYAISLNSSESLLLQSYTQGTLLISQIKDNILKKQQIIQTQHCIWVWICFIEDDFIAYQTDNSKNIEILKKNDNNQLFEKFQQIELKKGQDCESPCYIPIKYNQQKKVLISQNANMINVIQKMKNNQFILQQTLKFKSNDTFGALSDDGEYLITWNIFEHQIQIRKYQE